MIMIMSSIRSDEAVRINLALVSLDIRCPLVAAIYDDSQEPAFAFGSGAATNLQKPAKKALSKLALVRYSKTESQISLDDSRSESAIV